MAQLHLIFVANFLVTLCLCLFCLRNDLYCVGWGIKLYSITLH